MHDLAYNREMSGAEFRLSAGIVPKLGNHCSALTTTTVRVLSLQNLERTELAWLIE